jgi:hypothetical protein
VGQDAVQEADLKYIAALQALARAGLDCMAQRAAEKKAAGSSQGEYKQKRRKAAGGSGGGEVYVPQGQDPDGGITAVMETLAQKNRVDLDEFLAVAEGALHGDIITSTGDGKRAQMAFYGGGDVVRKAQNEVVKEEMGGVWAQTNGENAEETWRMYTEETMRTKGRGENRVAMVGEARKARECAVEILEIMSRKIGGRFAQKVLAASILRSLPGAEKQFIHADAPSTHSPSVQMFQHMKSPASYVYIYGLKHRRGIQVIPGSQAMMTVSDFADVGNPKLCL